MYIDAQWQLADVIVGGGNAIGAEQIETQLRQLGDLLLGAWGERCLQ